MAKPLFRWTCGPVSEQGLDILIESVRKSTQALGVDNFDWLICYNGFQEEELNRLKKSLTGFPIFYFSQNWTECPIEDNQGYPFGADGNFESNGNRCGGTLWKVCPARMRMETHEIVMDNDIVLLKKFPQIDEFLRENKVLILEEPIYFYGRYAHLLHDKPLNSGFMGFPPKYDFASEIRKVWKANGSLKRISQADEQGLLMATLSAQPSLRISKEQMVEILAKDNSTKITGEEQGIHFTQANRTSIHHAWQKYKDRDLK